MQNYWIYPARIGEPDGPCSEHCSHIVCIIKRHDAERRCLYCEDTIGWANEVYFVGERGALIAHRKCAEDRFVQITNAIALDKTANEDEAEWRDNLPNITNGWLLGELNNEEFNAALGTLSFHLTPTGSPII